MELWLAAFLSGVSVGAGGLTLLMLAFAVFGGDTP